MMSPRRRPCPFCGEARRLDLYRNLRFVGTVYWVHCKSCGASGGTASTKLGAVDVWNRREEESNASV